MENHSDEYQRGFSDGIDSFRPKFERITQAITATSCDGCQYCPVDGGNYSEVCATCSRFYPDHFDFKGE